MFIKLFKIILVLIIITSSQFGMNEYSCNHCNKMIIKSYIIFNDKNYHEICYRDFIQLKCDFCKKKIIDSFTESKSKKYHQSCFINNILEKCCICIKPLQGEYLIDFYNNKYHSYHNDELNKCSSCSRLISKQLTNGGYDINQETKVCAKCYPFIVNKDSQVSKINLEVRSLLSSVGIKKIPNHIPITLLKNIEDLKKYSGKNNNVIKGFTYYDKTMLGGVKIKENIHIYVLSNLHNTAFSAVLAHELLHAFLFVNNYNLRSDIREGFCNLGSKLIFDKTESELSDYLTLSMFENKDPDYGIGFIKMNEILKKKGWAKLIIDLNYLK